MRRLTLVCTALAVVTTAAHAQQKGVLEIGAFANLAYFDNSLRFDQPKAGPGARAVLLGLLMRKDGKQQVTYRGHPLYRFYKDTARGQVKGQGLDFFGGEWYVLTPAGKKLEHAAGSDDSTSAGSDNSGGGTTTGGGGYDGGGGGVYG